MRLGALVLRKLFPNREHDRMDLRMATKMVEAHAEDLQRTVKRMTNGHDPCSPFLPSQNHSSE